MKQSVSFFNTLFSFKNLEQIYVNDMESYGIWLFMDDQVVKLLEREGVRHSEENRGTLLIKVDGCSREFSFLDTESDSE